MKEYKKIIVIIPLILLFILLYNYFINNSIKQCEKLHSKNYCKIIIKDLEK